MTMGVQEIQVTDQMERFQDAGLTLAFLADMAVVDAALKAAGYETNDQLTYYVCTGNKAYITRQGNARELVLSMDVEDIKKYLRIAEQEKAKK